MGDKAERHPTPCEKNHKFALRRFLAGARLSLRFFDAPNIVTMQAQTEQTEYGYNSKIEGEHRLDDGGRCARVVP